MTLELERLEETEASKVIIPGANESPGSLQTQEAAIEAFPKVLNKISGLWGTRELDKLILELIMDSRGGTRQGFPVEVAEEILFMEGCNKYVRALEIADNMKISVKKAFQMVDSGDRAHTETDPWNDPTVSQDASVHTKKSPNAYVAATPRVEQSLNTDAGQKKGGSGALVGWIIALMAGVIVFKYILPLLTQ